MSEHEDKKPDSLILSPSTGLAKTSSALVNRGLQDILRKGWYWEHQSLDFGGRLRKSLAITVDGYVFTHHSLAKKDGRFGVEIHNLLSTDRHVWGSSFGGNELADLEEINFACSPLANACSPGLSMLCITRGVPDQPAELFIHTFGPFRLYPMPLCLDPVNSIQWSQSGTHLAVTFRSLNRTGGYIDLFKLFPSENRQPVRIESPVDGEWETLPPVLEINKIASFDGSWFTNPATAGKYLLDSRPCFGKFAFSPDGATLAVGVYGPDFPEFVALLRLPTLEMFGVIGIPWLIDLSWSRAGHLLVCQDTPTLWEISPDGNSSLLLTSHDFPFEADLCRCSPTQNITALYSKEGCVRIVDLRDGSLLTEHCDVNDVAEMTWSSDGKSLFVVSATGEAWIGSFQ